MRAFLLAVVAAVLLFMGTAAPGQNSPSIRFQDGAFRVAGWKAPAAAPPGGWGSLFSVYAGPGEVPMLGTYAIDNGALVFRSRFPLAPGVPYRAMFKPPGGTIVMASFAGAPMETSPVARVLNVYPSADILPSNQLRLYIYFSAPMSRGEAAQYIHIVDEDGKNLDGPKGIFLPGEELWDPNFTRLTLTFDPGRIKRGLTSNETVGPPIVEGKRYTLSINRDWRDARGVPMVEPFKKIFRGGAPVRTPPDPKQWRVIAPKAGSDGAVAVDFPRAMNYPLLQRMIEVENGRGRVAGTVSVAHDEAEWRFTPEHPWMAGDYRLVIDTGIEDLAGNHVGQPFDIDKFERVTERIATATVSLRFTVH